MRGIRKSEQRAASQYAAHRETLARKEEEIRDVQERAAGKEAALHSIETDIEMTGLIVQNVRVNLLRQSLEKVGGEKTHLEEAVEAQEHEVKCAWAVTKYLR